MYSRDDVGGGYLEVEDGGAEDSGDYPEPDALDPMDDDEDYSSDGPEAGEDEGLGAAGSDGDYDPYDDGDADVPMEMAGPLDRLGALKSAILQLESEGDFAGAEELREEYYTERAAEKIRADLTPLFGQARGFAEQQLVQGLRDDEVEVLQREVMPGVDPLQVAAYPKAAEALRYIAKGLAAERRERHGRVPGNERIASGGFGRIPGVDPREVSRFSQVFGDLGATPEDVAEFIRGDR